ncbi:MAG: ABC transporter ATP-binding protein [Ignavibacteria bacterium]|nr:ABC transporter ATP-binding protein [Ignavibacteria bacterium]
MDNKILIAENIKRKFKTGTEKTLEVLKGISLEIITGEIAVIVGASGAGKSTLLHIMGALDTPNEGKISINGNELFKMKDQELAKFRNKNIGFVFQFHHLLPEFTALENVSIPQMIDGKTLAKSEVRSKKLLDLVGLSERLNHKPAELSGGEQQRVAVARALANNPKIIFADEPSGNLDTQNSEALHQLINKLNKEFNQTFVIVTHNNDLMKLANRVFEIKDGKLNGVIHHA